MLRINRRISEHRSLVILAVIVTLSLASLATDTQASLLSRSVRTSVSVVAHPFWMVMEGAERGFDYSAALVRSHHDYYVRTQELSRRVLDLELELARTHEIAAENERLRQLLNYQQAEPQLTLELARIFTEPYYSRTLQINRGARHGIAPMMGVINADGVVGLVTQVEPFSAYVITLHHANCRIMAVTRRNRVYGVVLGSDFKGSHVCEMRYIDAKDEVYIGDDVITAGGGPFPPGQVIGRIVEVPYVEGSLFKTAYIEPAVDLARLNEVFVIRQAPVSEEELRGTRWEAPVLSNAAPLPDDRPLQERYAP